MMSKYFLITCSVLIAMSFMDHDNLKYISDQFSIAIWNITGFLKVLIKQPNQFDNHLITHSELMEYDGRKGVIYLAVLGQIFDVSSGAKFYAKGKDYHHFAATDASRAFITKSPDENLKIDTLLDDVIDLDKHDLYRIKVWLDFYHKEYKYVGKLIGRFYDLYGRPTSYLENVLRKIKDAEEDQQKKEVDKIKFPPCNVEWSMEQGSRIWCTKKSGGIERSWVGVPRQYYQPSRDVRCACVRLDNVAEYETKGLVKVYDSCLPQSTMCYVK